MIPALSNKTTLAVSTSSPTPTKPLVTHPKITVYFWSPQSVKVASNNQLPIEFRYMDDSPILVEGIIRKMTSNTYSAF